MQISEVLQTKGTQVVTTTPSSTVRELVALLAEQNLGAVVVSADGSRIDGIVSERDVVRRLATDPGTLDSTVDTIMTAVVASCTPDDTVDQLMRAMTDYRVRHIPVIVAGQLGGIISIGDVVKTRISELEFEREQLEHYISGA